MTRNIFWMLFTVVIGLSLTTCKTERKDRSREEAQFEEQQKRQQEAYEKKKAINIELDGLIKISLKKLKSEWEKGQYGIGEEGITFVFEIENKSNQEIVAFEGLTAYYDLFGEQIAAIYLTYDEGLKPFEKIIHKRRIRPIDDIGSFRALAEKNESKIKFSWTTHKALFTDGKTLLRDLYLLY